MNPMGWRIVVVSDLGLASKGAVRVPAGDGDAILAALRPSAEINGARVEFGAEHVVSLGIDFSPSQSGREKFNRSFRFFSPDGFDEFLFLSECLELCFVEAAGRNRSFEHLSVYPIDGVLKSVLRFGRG